VKPVFADTFYWIALLNPRDAFHQRVLDHPPRTIVTTDEVLSEFLTYCASNPVLRTAAALIVVDILADSDVQVIPQSRASFLSGVDLYRSRPDKGYSLADCISMMTMGQAGLDEVFTNDRHFEQEGFRPLFRDPHQVP